MVNLLIIFISLAFLILCIYLIYHVILIKRVISPSLYNNKYCGKLICKHEPDLNLSEPEYTKTYDKNIAKFALNLISVTSKDGDIKLPKNIKLLHKIVRKNEPLFGTITTSTNKDTIWITFRASKTVTDWISNGFLQQKRLNGSNSILIHEGFMNIYNSISEQIFNILNTKNKKQNIIVSGHSLGGAIAVITAWHLYKHGFDNIVLYTFGCPKVGGKGFINNVNNSSIVYYRIINTNDIIPANPPAVVPNKNDYTNPYLYYHCGILKSFDINAKSMNANHNSLVYYNGLEHIKN